MLYICYIYIVNFIYIYNFTLFNKLINSKTETQKQLSGDALHKNSRNLKGKPTVAITCVFCEFYEIFQVAFFTENILAFSLLKIV